jgi:hypothetical protein
MMVAQMVNQWAASKVVLMVLMMAVQMVLHLAESMVVTMAAY